jgi:hypothetical protein
MRGGFYRLLVGPRKLGQRLGWRSASASTVVHGGVERSCDSSRAHYPKVTDRNRTSASLFRAPKHCALI